MSNELWEKVSWSEGLYLVSSNGRVKRLNVKFKDSRGWAQNHPERIIKAASGDGGYKIVTLSIKGKRKTQLVHRLVASAFIPNKRKYPCVNHIDNDPGNNKLSNLEWCTYSQNTQHIFNQGRHNTARGEKAGGSKLTLENVKEIRFMINFGFKGSILADIYGVTKNNIYAIKNNKTWQDKL